MVCPPPPPNKTDTADTVSPPTIVEKPTPVLAVYIWMHACRLGNNTDDSTIVIGR